jgi:BirA family biotin operon repressor/biotin-[acetyl-CoA-carboxylase] ligase
MEFSLGPNALAAGYRLAAYDTIGSTSVEAMARAAAGDPGRLWVVAGEQRAGHGRRGRSWESPRGNLAASLLLVFPGRQPQAATLGFAAGLATADAIRLCGWGHLAPPWGAAQPLRSVVPGGRSGVRLKWPNDVLIDGAKAAGILLQSTAVPDGATCVVIGIGVNVAQTPADLPYPAVSLHAAGARHVAAAQLFTALAESWVEQDGLWDGGRGFGAVRRRWLELAAGIGAPIAVRSGSDVVRGAFETIDEEGRLVVRSADGGRRRIAAGDVHFGAAATAET